MKLEAILLQLQKKSVPRAEEMAHGLMLTQCAEKPHFGLPNPLKK